MLAVRQESFLLKKMYVIGIPEPTVLVIIFRVFIWPLSFINAGKKNQYPYAEFRNLIGNKRTRSFQKENDNNETSSSSYNDETTPKYKKRFWQNKKAKFNEFMVRKCGNLLKVDKVLFKTRKFLTQFVLAPLRPFLNLKLDRLSLLQLECEMNSTGYPDDHIW